MEQHHDSRTGLGLHLADLFRTRRLTSAFVLLSTLSVGIVAASAFTGKVEGKEQKVDTSDAAPLHVPPVTNTNPSEFARIVKMVGPAVVNINTESLPKQTPQAQGRIRRRGQSQGQQDPGDMQDFLNRFFGGQGGGDDDDSDNQSTEGHALGSGFIVDPRGYIITNNHVVEKADRIYVKLSTDKDNDSDLGRPATVIGTDKDTDLAVIKIDAPTPLPTVKLGNSDASQVGDWVLAIGSPFGLSQTVSAGIVSAKNRSITEGGSASQFQHFIQTDAAINPGNSGGPLVNMNGDVIGVNTAIYTQSMGSQGVGFAMPSNTVVDVYNMLVSPEHKVVRGSIGIQFQSMMSPAVARMYGFSGGGVMISSVQPGLPAAKAGLQPNDIITAIDGKKVKDGDELVAIISPRRPGSTVTITYLRNGKEQTATVSIIDRNKMEAAANGEDDNSDSTPDAQAAPSKLGIQVDSVPSALANQQNIHGGVIVTKVLPGSFADDSGLEVGDVLLELNRQPIQDAAQLSHLVQQLKPGSDVVFVVRKSRSRDKTNTFIGGTLR